MNTAFPPGAAQSARQADQGEHFQRRNAFLRNFQPDGRAALQLLEHDRHDASAHAGNRRGRLCRAPGWDLGFNIIRDDVLLENDKLRLKVGYFNNDIKNYITNDLVSIERCAGTATCYYDSAIWINRPGTTNMSGFEIEGSYDAGFAYANIS